MEQLNLGIENCYDVKERYVILIYKKMDSRLITRIFKTITFYKDGEKRFDKETGLSFVYFDDCNEVLKYLKELGAII